VGHGTLLATRLFGSRQSGRGSQVGRWCGDATVTVTVTVDRRVAQLQLALETCGFVLFVVNCDE